MAGDARLDSARIGKRDEYYTRLTDIEQELRHYRKHFQGKTVFCNCDDPFESNFFKYFVLQFNRLGLKKLICTCYTDSPVMGKQLSLFDVVPDAAPGTPYKAIVTSVRDADGDGGIDMDDIAELFKIGENELSELAGDGDFRSDECLELLEEADIVVTNPPFSLWHDFLALLMEYKRKFLIVGNKNAVSYKDVFPLLMNNELWIGNRSMNQDFWLYVPDGYEYEKLDDDGRRIKHILACWYTNLDIRKRHEEMILVRRYKEELYPKYDNYDAIEVAAVEDIPCDYNGVMGVPITFMGKHNPDQFEIIGIAKRGAGDPALKTREYSQQIQVDRKGKQSKVTKLNDGPAIKVKEPPVGKTYYIVDGEYYIQMYARILIRNKHPEKPKE